MLKMLADEKRSEDVRRSRGSSELLDVGGQGRNAEIKASADAKQRIARCKSLTLMIFSG